MIRRVITLSFVVALLAVGDVSARSYIETKVDARASAEAPAGSKINATIGGFPFVPWLLLSSSVSHVGIHIENLTAKVLTFATVDIDLRGVKLDRSKMFDRQARITKIDKGTVEVVLTQQALSDALHVPITMSDGRISVQILGKSFPVTPSITANGSLSLTAAGIPRSLTLAIPKSDYIPCIGNITVFAGRVEFTCEFNEIPAALLDVAQINS